MTSQPASTTPAPSETLTAFRGWHALIVVGVIVSGMACFMVWQWSLIGWQHPEGLRIAAMRLKAESQQDNWPLGDIPMASWPDEIRQLKPIAVRSHMQGILAVQRVDGREHYGIYIHNDTSAPQSGNADAYYPNFWQNIYRYRFKSRGIPVEMQTTNAQN